MPRRKEDIKMEEHIIYVTYEGKVIGRILSNRTLSTAEAFEVLGWDEGDLDPARVDIVTNFALAESAKAQGIAPDDLAAAYALTEGEAVEVAAEMRAMVSREKSAADYRREMDARWNALPSHMLHKAVYAEADVAPTRDMMSLVDTRDIKRMAYYETDDGKLLDWLKDLGSEPVKVPRSYPGWSHWVCWE